MITDNLFLYKNFKNGEILKNVLKVYDSINTEQKVLSEDEIKKLISSIVNSLARTTLLKPKLSKNFTCCNTYYFFSSWMFFV